MSAIKKPKKVSRMGISTQKAESSQIILNWHNQMKAYSNRCVQSYVQTNEQTDYNQAKSLPSFTSGLKAAFDAYQALNPSTGEVTKSLTDASELNYDPGDINQPFIDDLNQMYEDAGAGTQGSVSGTVDFEVRRAADTDNQFLILAPFDASGAENTIHTDQPNPDPGSPVIIGDGRDNDIRIALRKILDNDDDFVADAPA